MMRFPNMLMLCLIVTAMKVYPSDRAESQDLEVAVACMKPAPELLKSLPASERDAERALGTVDNEEIVAVAMDPLDSRAFRVVSGKNEYEVWARALSDGSTLLALINLTGEERKISVRVEDLGVAGTLRDLWKQQDVGVMTWSGGRRVKPRGAALCKIIPFSPYTEAVREDVPGPDYTPEEVCRSFTKNLLSRRMDHGLHYAEVCTAIGALRAAQALDDQTLTRGLMDRYGEFRNESSRFNNFRDHVDISVRGSLPLELFRITQDEAYLEIGLRYADEQWDHPRPDGLSRETRWWIDDMYMIGMLQIQACRASGDVKYANRAADTLIAYSEKLQRPNGLFYHGPDYPHFWGRGNGWVAVGMAEVLKSLPKSNERYPALLPHYQKMMAALKKQQADNGMWRQLIDHPEAWDETSCTAMFGYAMLLGIESGALDAAEYRPVISKAWDGLTRYLNPDGTVRQVCMGTGQDKDPQYYLDRPRIIGDYHGQAPVLWFANELLKYQTTANR